MGALLYLCRIVMKLLDPPPRRAHFAGMIVEVFAGAILANFVTFTIIYNLWKLTKNERDIKAIIVLIVCAGIIVLVGLVGSGRLS